MTKELNTVEIDYMLHACACVNLRTGARVVTQLYNKLLKETNLKVTQYYMLVTIFRNKDITISNLGETMLLDQTTVTRNVNLLKESGYVDITRDDTDSRIKIITLTDDGLNKLHEATPIWLQVQEKIENEIGREKYNDLVETLGQLQEVIKNYES